MAATVLIGYLTSLSLIVAIGAQNAFVLRQGLRREHVTAVVALCALADLALISAGILGLGAVVSAHPALVTIIRWVGAGFLLVYGVLALRRAVRPSALRPAEVTGAGLRRTVLTGLALTFLNPHVYLDTVVLLGAIANQYGDGRWAFGAGAVTASVTWFVALGFGAGRLAQVFARPNAWRVLDLGIGLIMCVLAALLVLR